MNIAVVNYLKLYKNSIIASNKIAKYIAKKLNAVIIDDANIDCNIEYDFVFIVNSIWSYCSFRDKLVKLLNQNKRFVLVMNDIAIGIPKEIAFIQEKDLAYLVSFDNHKGWENYYYVNWNLLAYKDCNYTGERIPALIYYGAYRSGRVNYFKKYFTPPLNYDLRISTSRRNAGKFGLINNQAIYYKPFVNLYKSLVNFTDTLYIEDKVTHKVYCSPAARFYEAIGGGLYVHFDVNCRNTFDRVGINICEWEVATSGDIIVGNEKERIRQNKFLKKWVNQSELDDGFVKAVRDIGINCNKP